MESSSPVSTLRIYGQRSSAPLVFLRACASIQAASLHCLLRVQREAASLHCLLRVQREAAASMVGDAVHRRRPTPRCHTLASRAPQRLPIGSTAARAAFPRRAAVTLGDQGQGKLKSIEKLRSNHGRGQRPLYLFLRPLNPRSISYYSRRSLARCNTSSRVRIGNQVCRLAAQSHAQAP